MTKTREDTIKRAEEVCGFLNQRFGYQLCLAIALEELGIDAKSRALLLKYARDRKIDQFEDLLKALKEKK